MDPSSGLSSRSAGIRDPSLRIIQGEGIITKDGALTMRDQNIHISNTYHPGERVLSPEEAKKALVESLEFQGMNERFQSVEDNTPNTCNWLLKTVEMREWQTSFDTNAFRQLLGRGKVRHRRLFWIKGQPGAGKSTYMKFAVQLTRTNKSFKGNRILYHFFNARAPNELAKSTEGMYRTFLTQVLQDLSPESVHRLILRLGVTPRSTWKLEILSTLLKEVLQEDNNRPVSCFIDALDECAVDQVRDMVTSFRNLSEGGLHGLKFRVCFASRYYPTITVSEDAVIEVRLDQQPGHLKDIQTYITTHLYSQIAENIRKEVLEKAKGVFIWCKLVVGMLNKEYDRGHLNQEIVLREKLATLPEDLHEMYCEILLRRGAHSEAKIGLTTLCMQWVLFSKNRDIGPLWWAIQRAEQPRTKTEDLEYMYQNLNQDDMKRYILDTCKGLLEVVEPRREYQEDQEHGELQVIHESVREFLSKGGLRQLMEIRDAESIDGDLEATARSHEELAQIAYDEGFERNDTLFERWPKFHWSDARWHEHTARLERRNPLLIYSSVCVHHANEGYREGNRLNRVGHDDFLEKLGQQAFMDRYLQLCNLSQENPLGMLSVTDMLIHEEAEYLLRAYYCRPEGIQHAKRLSLHHHLEAKDCSAGILRSIVGIYLDWYKPGSNRRAALQLLAKDVDFGDLRGHNFEDEEDVVLAIGERYQLLGIFLVGALLPLTAGAEEVLATWESMRESDPAPTRDFASFLGLALTRITQIEAAQILDLGMTLCYAGERGLEALAALLLNTFNTPCNVRRRSGLTPLHLAAKNGHNSVVKVLLSSPDIDPDLRNIEGETALHLAVTHLDVTESLTAPGRADVNAKTDKGNTPLHLAVAEDCEAVVKALLKAPEIDANLKGYNGETPLHVAVRRGCTLGLLQLLLENRQVDVNVQDTRGYTPLHKAVHSPARSMDALRSLLATSKTDVNMQTYHGTIPLGLAVELGIVTFVKALLATGRVELEGMKDNDGDNLLHLAAYAGSSDIAKILLATGKVDLNARNADKRTPRGVAWREGHPRLAMLLTKASFLQHRSHHPDPEPASS